MKAITTASPRTGNSASLHCQPVMRSVCAGHGTGLAGCKSPRQVLAEPKARRRARALSRGGV